MDGDSTGLLTRSGSFEFLRCSIKSSNQTVADNSKSTFYGPARVEIYIYLKKKQQQKIEVKAIDCFYQDISTPAHEKDDDEKPMGLE